MKQSEVTALLALVQAGDQRNLTVAAESLWAAVLTPGMQFDDAVEAVRHHFGTSTDYLMPAHVNRRVAEVRRQRVQACQVVPEVPAGLHQSQERAWIALFWQAVKRGELDPQAAADADMGLRRPELPAADPAKVRAMERLAVTKAIPHRRTPWV
jgi:hypothetical protein